MRTPRTIRYVCRRPDFQADPRATGDIATPHQKYLLLSANILRLDAKHRGYLSDLRMRDGRWRVAGRGRNRDSEAKRGKTSQADRPLSRAPEGSRSRVIRSHRQRLVMPPLKGRVLVLPVLLALANTFLNRLIAIRAVFGGHLILQSGGGRASRQSASLSEASESSPTDRSTPPAAANLLTICSLLSFRTDNERT
jgi:hypothetical protein